MNATDYKNLLETLKMKDGKWVKIMARPFINPLTLLYTGPIEVRFFRQAKNIEEVRGAFKFIDDMIREALSSNPKSAKELFVENNYKLPEFFIDKEQIEAWFKRKKELGKKSFSKWGGNKSNNVINGVK